MDMEIVFPGGKKVDAIYGGFTIKTDQPVEKGGEGSAPAPFDLFLSSIGACAGLYVLGFCQERTIPTDGLKLMLHPEKDNETGMIVKIGMEIQLPPGFPERYEKAVIRVAEHCAVKKHLMNPPVFDIYTKAG